MSLHKATGTCARYCSILHQEFPISKSFLDQTRWHHGLWKKWRPRQFLGIKNTFKQKDGTLNAHAPYLCHQIAWANRQSFLGEASLTKESLLEPRAGFEPATYSLQGCRSSRWAIEAHTFPLNEPELKVFGSILRALVITRFLSSDTSKIMRTVTSAAATMAEIEGVFHIFCTQI